MATKEEKSLARSQGKALSPEVVSGALAEALGGVEGIEIVQTGGITKWVDLRKFQDNPETPQGVPCMGNGKAFVGQLISRQEIEVDDDEAGEMNADGVKVRYFYNLRLLAPCPVAYKDEEKKPVEEMAQAGEVVSIGERHKLTVLREWCDDGGSYVVGIQPHSRIKVGGGRTMWTFTMGRKILRLPMRAQLVSSSKPPF